MLNFLKGIVKYISRLYARVKWFLQYSYMYLSSSKDQKVMLLQVESLGHSVILVPHADDELIGCSQILSIRSSNCTCDYFHMYGCDLSEENVKTRDREINDYMHSLGVRIVDVFSEEDLFESLIYADSIFLPCPFDWHWQHREVFYSLVNLLDKLPDRVKFYYYYVSVPFPASSTLIGLPLSREKQVEKWESFKTFYHSQAFMPLTRYKLHERLDSSANTWYAAEVYMPRNKQQLIIDSKLKVDDNLIKSSIQSIIGIRQLSSSFNGLSK